MYVLHKSFQIYTILRSQLHLSSYINMGSVTEALTEMLCDTDLEIHCINQCSILNETLFIDYLASEMMQVKHQGLVGAPMHMCAGAHLKNRLRSGAAGIFKISAQ